MKRAFAEKAKLRIYDLRFTIYDCAERIATEEDLFVLKITFLQTGLSYHLFTIHYSNYLAIHYS